MGAKIILLMLTYNIKRVIKIIGVRKMGEYIDKWKGMESEVTELVNYMKKSIESSLNL